MTKLKHSAIINASQFWFRITNEGLSKKRSERRLSQNGEIRKLQSCSVRFQDRTELDQQLPKYSQTARNTMSILCQNCKRKKTERHVQLTLRFSWNISHKVKTILALTWNKKVKKKVYWSIWGQNACCMALEVHTQLLITENRYYNEFRFQVRFDFDQDRQYFKSFFLL